MQRLSDAGPANAKHQAEKLMREGKCIAHGLTTAATAWVTTALGLACGLASWTVATTGTIITVIILIVLRWIEERWHISG